MVLLYYDLEGQLLKSVSGGGRPVASSTDEYALCAKTFEAAVDRLSHVANELDLLAQSTTAAVAAIEAQGDRIDRLQVDNQALIDDLLKGS